MDILYDIGIIAGKIYHLLEKGEKNISNIKKPLKLEGYSDNYILMAIGWLARENKIDIYKKDRQVIVKLIDK